MKFELVPPISAGPVRIGMPLTEAEAILDALEGHVVRDPSPQSGFRDFVSGLSIAFAAKADRNLVAIELYRPDDASDIVTFGDIDVFNTPAESLIEFLESRTRIRIEENGHSVIATDLPLGFRRPILPQFQGDEEGRYFDSVVLAQSGYYDTPDDSIEQDSTGLTPSFLLEQPSTTSVKVMTNENLLWDELGKAVSVGDRMVAKILRVDRWGLLLDLGLSFPGFMDGVHIGEEIGRFSAGQEITVVVIRLAEHNHQVRVRLIDGEL